MPSSAESRKSCRKTKGSDWTDWARSGLASAEEVVVRSELGFDDHPAQLHIFALGCPHQVTHVKRAVSFGGRVGGGHRDVADGPARKLERLGEEIQVEVGSPRHGAPKASLP